MRETIYAQSLDSQLLYTPPPLLAWRLPAAVLSVVLVLAAVFVLFVVIAAAVAGGQDVLRQRLALHGQLRRLLRRLVPEVEDAAGQVHLDVAPPLLHALNVKVTGRPGAQRAGQLRVGGRQLGHKGAQAAQN